MLKISLFTYFFCSLTLFLSAQKSDTIPFVLTPYNNIFIQSILNKTDTLNLMFHTGQNSVSITEEALTRLVHSPITDSSEANSWGGTGVIQHFKNNQLSIGTDTWDNLTIWVNKHSGRLTDGKFGPDLFGDKMIEINYDKSILVLHAALSKKQLHKNYQKFKLHFSDHLMFIEGILKIGNKRYKNKFMIHSGFGGTLLLDDAFAQKHALAKQLEIISESELRDSYGNVLITKKAMLPSFKIGKSVLKNLPISFFDGAIGRQKISVLGGEILKRYHTILDIKGGYIYLQTNQQATGAFSNS